MEPVSTGERPQHTGCMLAKAFDIELTLHGIINTKQHYMELVEDLSQVLDSIKYDYIIFRPGPVIFEEGITHFRIFTGIGHELSSKPLTVNAMRNRFHRVANLALKYNCRQSELQVASTHTQHHDISVEVSPLQAQIFEPMLVQMSNPIWAGAILSGDANSARSILVHLKPHDPCGYSPALLGFAKMVRGFSV